MEKSNSRAEAIKEVEGFFLNINNKSSREVKKIKTLAMRDNIPLGEKRKSFCKKCFAPYGKSKVRIKNGIKSSTCENCSFVSLWRIK